MKREVLAIVLLTLLLSGCSNSGRSYVHVIPHYNRTAGSSVGSAPAENYVQLQTALQDLVQSGTESGIIYTVKMDETSIDQNMAVASRYIQTDDAVGAYAVEDIHYEIGTTGGKTAVAVTVDYRHSGVELNRILHLTGMEDVRKAIAESLESCQSGLVMYVQKYSEMDIQQAVQDIAYSTPQLVMEIPEAVESVYGSGESRVLELSFSYENSRESLRMMQAQVKPVFDSAALYVSGEGTNHQKFSQLYAFLMERFDYTINTSITPSYSLLRHGVGDSRAFATVYAAMCKDAGLECMTVTGSRNGQSWTWNIVNDDGRYYHVDLLKCNEVGAFLKMNDSDMTGYVWDYSAYPECREGDEE